MFDQDPKNVTFTLESALTKSPLNQPYFIRVSCISVFNYIFNLASPVTGERVFTLFTSGA